MFLERPAAGTPHSGKVLLAVQAHSDDIPLTSAGTVAKLVSEGYTGYLVRATNDDMGDARGLGTRGTVGENVLGTASPTRKRFTTLARQPPRASRAMCAIMPFRRSEKRLFAGWKRYSRGGCRFFPPPPFPPTGV